MSVTAGSPGGDELVTVTVARDEHGYGMKVSGDNPVYVQSVKEHGAAWRAGLRAGDRILRVGGVPVHAHTHQQVVHMIRANPTTVLTVYQNSSRHKTPITAPVPVNPEKQRQLEVSKVYTMRLMLEQEQKYIRDLRNELLKVPDVRKQAQLESAEQRCATLQHEIDSIMASQTDNRGNVPVLHVRSQSSPEHLDHGLPRSCERISDEKESWSRGTPPPGTPPPPYAHNVQPCADPQRAIISMEEDDSPASENSTYSGLFSNLRSVRESKARTAILLNWLLGERRCACASLLLLVTDGYRSAAGAPADTLRRWAYEIQSTFLMPDAVLQLSGVDENMVNEIEHVLVNEYEKEELLRNVFRKARQKAQEELAQQLSEFQVKRQVGLATLYGPDDGVIQHCDVDRAQEQVVVERIMCQRLSAVAGARGGCAARGGSGGSAGAGGPGGAGGAEPEEAHAALLAALVAAALQLHCRPASVAAAVGGARAAFLQRDKLYKQRVKQLAKRHPHPLVVRGHHLQLQALTAAGHCHHCELVIWGLAPQAYVCTDCKLRVHRGCARRVEEPCCLDGAGAGAGGAGAGAGAAEHANNRISRFMERIHHTAAAAAASAAANGHPPGQDSNDKKSRKSSGTSHFLNMERSFRKQEDEQAWDSHSQGDSRREGSSEEQPAADVDTDLDHAPKDSDAKDSWRAASGRGVNRAESCREREPRDAPRRGKHRNASDPNRLTAHHAHDLEPGAPTAPSGSSSSSSLSSRSNESNTPAVEQHASQSDWSEEDEPLAAQWVDSLPPDVLDSLSASPRLRKRQEVIHELIVSEGSHVRWLKVLGREFLRPLERQPALLPSEELRALFPNLPAVRERHEKLYAELRAARAASGARAAPPLPGAPAAPAAPAAPTAPAGPHLVPVGHVADAMLNTLGEGGYAACLSRFCRGQRMALEALRERRRKHKELHHFLAAREQLPRCGRLQLRDLLACVWQRLTKYQLLLEGVLATLGPSGERAAGTEGAEGEASEDASAADVARLRRALATAKDVLHCVDTAIRAAENEHRLRTIQNKLEVRASGPEWEELRRLELPARALRTEGDLSIRVDANKKISVLALLLEDSLVLLQREGDRFVLKPIASQQGALSPLVKWDKVLFRPNAAVRNTFFLMNINGVQMHELSANTAAEYATWVKCIQESPLAKLTELKPSITPSHQASRSTDDSGINVSRNPSDASEKSDKSSSVALRDEPVESERDRERERERDSRSLERSSAERDRDGDRSDADVTEREKDDNCVSVLARPAVARQSPAGGDGGGEDPTGGARGPLEARAALAVRDPPAERLLAATALSPQERLRRLDAVVGRALAAKARVVCAALGVPPAAYRHVAELAVADTMGLVDVPGELRASRLERSSSSEDESTGHDDIHQLLLAAHAQVSQLTALVNKALTVDEAAVVAARARPRPPRAPAGGPTPPPAAPADRCDRCSSSLAAREEMEEPMDDTDDALPAELEEEIERVERASETARGPGGGRERDGELSFDMLAELDALPADLSFECGAGGAAGAGGGGAAELAARAAGPCAALGAAVGRLAAALPPWAAAARASRAELAALRDGADRDRARRLRHGYQMTEEISFPTESVDQIQDQPSNGG